jgi:hypothetical protein
VLADQDGAHKRDKKKRSEGLTGAQTPHNMRTIDLLLSAPGLSLFVAMRDLFHGARVGRVRFRGAALDKRIVLS